MGKLARLGGGRGGRGEKGKGGGEFGWEGGLVVFGGGFKGVEGKLEGW